MPDPNKVHRENINKADFNYMFFCMMAVAVALNIFLTWIDIEGGSIYNSMFTGISGLMFWLFFWVKDDNTMGPITDYIKVPISTRLTLSSALYLAGLAAPFILYGITKLFQTSYNVTKLAIPLFGSSIEQAFQTYSAANVGNSMSWTIFLVMFDAGTMETFVYNLGLPMISVLFGLLIFQLASKDGKTLFFMSKKTFVLIVSVILIPTLAFALSHVMNKTYGLVEFVFASGFLILSNSSIYFMGMMILFWVGYHQANNLLALIIKYGFIEVANGFMSWFGFIFIPFILLVLYYVINNFDQVVTDWKLWWNSKANV